MTGGPPAAEEPRRKRPAREQFASTVLVLEAVLVLFAGLVGHGLRVAPIGTVWAVAGSLAVVLVILSRFVAAPGGTAAGSIVQVLVLATGLVVPLMVVLGGLFVVLWVVALQLGSRIDRERAAWDAAHPEQPGPPRTAR